MCGVEAHAHTHHQWHIRLSNRIKCAHRRHGVPAYTHGNAPSTALRRCKSGARARGGTGAVLSSLCVLLSSPDWRQAVHSVWAAVLARAAVLAWQRWRRRDFATKPLNIVIRAVHFVEITLVRSRATDARFVRLPAAPAKLLQLLAASRDVAQCCRCRRCCNCCAGDNAKDHCKHHRNAERRGRRGGRGGGMERGGVLC